MPLQVELVSPEGTLFEGEGDMVIARTMGGGDIAFLPGHIPFVGTLAIGQVKVIQSGGKEQVIAVHRGFVSMAHDKVTILSDVAELPENIDVGRAEAAKAAAEESLRANSEDAEAKAALRRAEIRLALGRQR